MSVRFVLGRARAGKTHHCLESIRTELAQCALGQALVLLVPEQAAAQMERALLAKAEFKGTFRAQVLSFRRLTYKVLGDAGKSQAIIPPAGERMILRHVLQEQAGRLKAYGAVVGRAGLVKKLLENLKELLSERTEPSDLLETAQQLGNIELSDKLNDLALLLEAYQQYTQSHGLESAGALDELAQRIETTPWLAQARIWVDGFAGFTAGEIQVLLELAQTCEHMDICLLLEPDFEPSKTKSQIDDPLRLFRQTEQTYTKVLGALRKAGVEIEEPLRLSSANQENHAELAELEEHLFGPAQAKSKTLSKVTLTEAADRRSEVEAVVRQIVMQTRTGNDSLHYRDIAVIVRDLSAYDDLLANNLAEQGIPFFIDRRYSLAHHSLVEVVRSALALVEDDFSPQAVRALLKTGLLGIEQEQLDRLENYIIAHGVKGAQSWQGDVWNFGGHMVLPGDAQDTTDSLDEEVSQINATRQAILERVEGWCQWALGGSQKKTVKDWVGAIVNLLEHLQLPEQLSSWTQQAQKEGRTELAQQHQRAWECLGELLEQMVAVLGDEQIELTELRDILEAGMADFTLGLVPPKLDQVLVGTLQRSRHPQLRAVFLIGMNEGLFPRSSTEDSVLSDRQRKMLENKGLILGPTAEELFYRERMLAYIALTRARDCLWISYAAADQKGKALNVSPFVTEVLRALPALELRHLKEDDPGLATTPERLAGKLAGRFRAGLEDLPKEITQRWLGAYHWLSCHGRSDKIKKIMSSLVYKNIQHLEIPTRKQLLGQTLRTSNTGLESFSACPFKHFSGRLLKLQQRADAELENVDLGRLYHKAMEILGRELIGSKERLAQMSQEEATKRIVAISEELVEKLAEHEPALTSGRNQFLAGYVHRHLSEAVAGGQYRNGLGQLYPVAVEQKFGLGDEGWPGLVFGLGKGRSMELRGIIDLLELAKSDQTRYAVVYDYKRSREKKFKLSNAYYGLDLQLLIYMMVVREFGPETLGAGTIDPIGGFYISLKGASVKKGSPGEEYDEEQWLSRSQPRGLFRADKLELIDKTTAGKLRAVYGRLNKDGRLNKYSDGLSEENFETVLAYGKKEIRRLGHEILSGIIQVEPYRRAGNVPCSYCDYRSVCRIDPMVDKHRELEITNDQEALEKMWQNK